MKIILSALTLCLLLGIVWFAQESNQPAELSATQHQAVISRHDILTASDLTQGVKQAVQNNDLSQVDVWLLKALDVAEAAGLPADDIQYIQSDLAKKVVIFQAKRSLFNDEIEHAYYAIEDISPIKSKYPEAQDLFVKVDSLIKQRNVLIQELALELAAGEPMSDSFLMAAQKQWKERFAPPQN